MRAFGQGLLAAHQVEGVELYPKRDRLADGPEAAFESYRSFVPPQPAAAVTEPPEELTGTLSERIKASVTVLEFVSQCVDLKPMASGAVGLCPFHLGPLSRLSPMQAVRLHLTPAKGFAVSALPSHCRSPFG